MKIFRDKNNNLHALELDGSQDFLIQESWVQISAEEAEKIREYNKPKLTYAQERAAEYPPITDYLDAVVKGDEAAIQAYIDACKAVKEKYPKV